MPRTSEDARSPGAARSPTGTPISSQGLEWLWQLLRDVRYPGVLDCGRVSPSTVKLLLSRDARLYVADVLAPLAAADARFWNRSGKVPIFLTAEFLNQFSTAPPGSLALILCWNLFDLLPHEALPAVMARLFSLLQPLGVLFAVLREPSHSVGVEQRWWLETMTAYRNESDPQRHFSYPVVTNREMERLAPNASIKTFLTRSGRREILVMRRPESE